MHWYLKLDFKFWPAYNINTALVISRAAGRATRDGRRQGFSLPQRRRPIDQPRSPPSLLENWYRRGVRQPPKVAPMLLPLSAAGHDIIISHCFRVRFLSWHDQIRLQEVFYPRISREVPVSLCITWYSLKTNRKLNMETCFIIQCLYNKFKHVEKKWLEIEAKTLI